MAVAVAESQDGAVIEVTASGKLSREDYGTFVPLLENRMKQGKVRILFLMQDFTGWDAGALWEDIKFDIRHFGDIERLAMVGDKSGKRAWLGSASHSPRPRLPISIRDRSILPVPGYAASRSTVLGECSFATQQMVVVLGEAVGLIADILKKPQ